MIPAPIAVMIRGGVVTGSDEWLVIADQGLAGLSRRRP